MKTERLHYGRKYLLTIHNMEQIKKLRQTLAVVMSKYAEKHSLLVWLMCTSLYEKYNVSSRSELSEEQLQECIKYYQDWLNYE